MKRLREHQTTARLTSMPHTVTHVTKMRKQTNISQNKFLFFIVEGRAGGTAGRQKADENFVTARNTKIFNFLLIVGTGLQYFLIGFLLPTIITCAALLVTVSRKQLSYLIFFPKILF